MTQLGSTIRKKRLEKGMTQAELAHNLGDERRPSNALIQKLAACLNLPADRLFFLANPKMEEVLRKPAPLRTGSPLPAHLSALAADKALRRTHHITDTDIALLASIHARGEVSSKEDYVYLLMTIRQLFQE